MPRRRRRDVAQIERDARAVDLRRDGLTYRRIATELGCSSGASAYEAVQRGLADTIGETNDEVRRLELDRLDHLCQAALKVLETEHVTVSHGHVIRREVGQERDEDGQLLLDGDGKPIPIYEDLLDDAPVLNAIDRLLKIQDRRAKLLGLDAPVRSEVVTIDAIDAEIARLEREIAGRAEAGEAPPPPRPSNPG